MAKDIQKQAEGPWAWYEMEDPCALSTNFEHLDQEILLSRAAEEGLDRQGLPLLGLLAAFNERNSEATLISMAHGFPAAVLFLNSRLRFS